MPFITTSVGGGSGQGSALNYQQNVVSPVAVSNSGTLITGVEMMTTGKPVQISVTGEATNETAGSWIIIQLHHNNTPIGNAIQLEASAVSENVPYALNFIYTPEAGGHDFNLKAIDKSPGNWTFGEAGGPVFNAVELTGFKGDTGDQGPAGADGTSGDSGPKTWTSSNNVEYGIYQAHGGLEVTTEDQTSETYSAIGYGNQNNSTSFPLIIPDSNLNDMLVAVMDGSLHLRKITISVGGVERTITPNYSPGAGPEGYTWYFNSISPINISDEATYTLNITYGSPPVLWWDAVDLGFDIANDDFRGAKIEYHAYVPDGGTMIGTIYIASDSGDAAVTHIETGSGGNDLGTASWWYRKNGWQEEERRLYFYRTDGEANTHKIQWTAQVYYASEYRD